MRQTDRFAIETLEISDTNGNSEYWSLSTAEAFVMEVGLRIHILLRMFRIRVRVF